MADLQTLFTAHLVGVRTAAKAAGVDLDATTLVTKNIPTMRAAVAVPECDINTEMLIYIMAHG